MTLRLLLVGSAGGHLAQLESMRPWWGAHRRWWVTFDTPDARSVLSGERVIWGRHSDARSVLPVLRSLLLAVTTVARLRPDAVVTTGASIGVMFIVVARLLGIPTVYVEVFDRIRRPSLSGRIAYRIADEFAVQWREQLVAYPRAQLVGPLL